MFTSKLSSPIGELYISAENNYIVSVSFFPVQTSDGEKPEIIQQAERELNQYFLGERKNFEVPVHLDGTRFRLDCLKALKEVEYGEKISYSELARRAGHPKAVRAVASVCASNSIAIIYPCHRIIRKNGAYGRYGGGDNVKIWLLEHESNYS